MRALYRALARRCHPDLGVDTADRERRRVFMIRVNDACAQGDADLLGLLAAEWLSRQQAPDRSPGAAQASDGTAARKWGWHIGLDGGYQPAGEGVASLIATVTMIGPLRGPAQAEVFILDASAHMDAAWLAAVKEAVTAALGRLQGGTLFAIVAGGDEPWMVYPAEDRLAVADGLTLAEAGQALATLAAGTGHAAVGRWLGHARRLLEPYPEAIRHAQLLVAGPFGGESLQEAASSIARCEGIFTCDCRGLGVNWKVGQLRVISSALLGTVDIAADPRGLKAEVMAMTDKAMSQATADMRLRLLPAEGARIRFIRQVAPTVEELTGRAAAPPEAPAARDYPTGAWRPGETRVYHIGIDNAPERPACHVTAMIPNAPGEMLPASELAWLLLAAGRYQASKLFRRPSRT